MDSISLEGPIPTEFGGFSSVTRMVLQQNDLTGPIPTELSQCSNLLELSINSNELTAAIPSELGELTALSKIMFRHSQLVGFVVCTNISGLTFSSSSSSSLIAAKLFLQFNDLRGEMPSEICDLVSMHNLESLGSDCLGFGPLVECPCCTRCT